MTSAVRYTQPLFGAVAGSGYLVSVPNAVITIRQNAVACPVFADNAQTPFAGGLPTGRVPAGVAEGAPGLDVTGNLSVYLLPGRGYSGQAVVGGEETIFAIPDISPDVDDVQTPIPSGTYAGTPVPGTPATAVATTGNQTVAGIKTFSSSPILPGDATTALQAVPKQQHDADLAPRPIHLTGTLAARPAAGTSGRFYIANDVWRTYRDDGTRWRPLDGKINVLDYGADPTFVADSVSAFRAAVTDAALLAFFTGRLAEIEVPAGKYKFVATSSAFGGVWHVGIASDNVVFVGEGEATEISSAVDAHLFFFDGGGKPAGLATWYLNQYVDATTYTIAPAAQYTNTVTTTTPANAGNFAAGDLVVIRTGNTLADPFGLDYPDSETNEVESVNAGTGVVTLRHPLTKPYAQEYFVTGTSGVSSTAVTANLAVLGIAKVTDRTLRNVGVRNMRFVALSQSAGRSCVNGSQTWGLVVEDITAEVSSSLIGANSARSSVIRRNTIYKRGGGTADYLIGFGMGSSHVDISENACESLNFGFLHLHEGVANPRVFRNTVILASVTPTSPQLPISIRARSYGAEVDYNTIINATAGAAGGVYIDNSCVAGGRVSNTIVVGQNVPTSVLASGTGWIITGTRGSGTVINSGTNNKLWNNENTADTFGIVSLPTGTYIQGVTELQLLAAAGSLMYFGAPGDTSYLYFRRPILFAAGKGIFFEEGAAALSSPGNNVVVVGTSAGVGCIRTGRAVTGSRPSAVTVGAGSQFYDTTLSKPIWSDGTVWRDAAGVAV